MTAHYLMVGGFLGAGKTTALIGAGRYLTARGYRVGLIMNDQSDGLVDTALVRSQQMPVEEIAGGCFCCRFNSLVDAAARLDAAARPDVFLAEPVGSCTDLVATVALPLRQIYGDRFAVAPLSVLVDADRALRVLGVEPGRSFSPKVVYVYRKQLEEADVIVVNKVDATPGDRVRALRAALEREYPHARVIEMAGRTGAGLPAWIDGLLRDTGSHRVLDIDYDTYADGEALLGWLNATVRLDGIADADALLQSIAGRVHRALADRHVEIAHLKLTLTPGSGGIAVVNAVRTDRPPELAFALDAQVDAGEITINVRAEVDPLQLERAVRDALTEAARDAQVTLTIDHLERFRPGRPVPTHRLAAVE